MDPLEDCFRCIDYLRPNDAKSASAAAGKCNLPIDLNSGFASAYKVGNKFGLLSDFSYFIFYSSVYFVYLKASCFFSRS